MHNLFQAADRASSVTEMLTAWLRESNPAAGDFGPDSQLTSEGILDSFQFVNFLLYIEHIRGAEIDRSRIDPKAFATLNSIVQNFFDGSVPSR